jgi:hypothetical protein
MKRYFSFNVMICPYSYPLTIKIKDLMFCIYGNLKLVFTYTEKNKNPQLLTLEFKNILQYNLHVCHYCTLHHRRKTDTYIIVLLKPGFFGSLVVFARVDFIPSAWDHEFGCSIATLTAKINHRIMKLEDFSYLCQKPTVTVRTFFLKKYKE